MKGSRKIGFTLSALVMVVALGLPAWGQEAQPEFVRDLLSLLEQEGWTAEEVSALAQAAGRLDWSGAEEADSEVVALALGRMRQEEGAEGAEPEPLAQAEAALQLALSAVEMEALGYEERVVARTALQAASTLVSDIKTWKEGGQVGNLGEIVRGTVSTAVQNATREQSRQTGRPDAAGFGLEQAGGYPTGSPVSLPGR